MKTAAVSVQNLSKTFKTSEGRVEAVQDLSFTIAPGQVIALLGENGAGKSTLIDMLLGLSTPSSGHLEIFGSTPATALREGRVSAMFQSGGLLTDLTVRDQVAMVAAAYRASNRCDEVLRRAGIADIAGRKISKCSGGQQQKVKFALALLAQADLLSLDEPTVGLDPSARAVFWSDMREQARAGATIIFATRYLQEAQDFSDRLLVLNRGALVHNGPADLIRKGHRTVSFALESGRFRVSADQKKTWQLESQPAQPGHYSFTCQKVEDFLRYLLATHPVHDLEVSRPDLAEVFTNLTHSAYPIPSPRRIITMFLLRFMGYDLKQSLCNTSSLFYLIIMPVGFYLLFGVMQDYGDYSFREGNAAAYVMLGMAVYGAVAGATAAAGGAVVEIQSGWGRQLALTPLSTSQLATTRTVTALVSTGLPILCVNLTALFTKAVIPPIQQVFCALTTLVTASIFTAYGSLIARIFKNARAVSVAAGLLVFFSFFGTTFSPLPPEMLPVARLTPLYGITQLSRYFFTGGDTITTDSVHWMVTEPVSYALLNFLFWATLLVGGNILLARRSRSR